MLCELGLLWFFLVKVSRFLWLIGCNMVLMVVGVLRRVDMDWFCVKGREGS